MASLVILTDITLLKEKNSKDFKLKRAFYTMGWREGTSRYFKKQTVVPILDTVEEL